MVKLYYESSLPHVMQVHHGEPNGSRPELCSNPHTAPQPTYPAPSADFATPMPNPANSRPSNNEPQIFSRTRSQSTTMHDKPPHLPISPSHLPRTPGRWLSSPPIRNPATTRAISTAAKSSLSSPPIRYHAPSSIIPTPTKSALSTPPIRFPTTPRTAPTPAKPGLPARPIRLPTTTRVRHESMILQQPPGFKTPRPAPTRHLVESGHPGDTISKHETSTARSISTPGEPHMETVKHDMSLFTAAPRLVLFPRMVQLRRQEVGVQELCRTRDRRRQRAVEGRCRLT